MSEQFVADFRWTAPDPVSRSAVLWFPDGEGVIRYNRAVPVRHYRPLTDEPAIHRVLAATPPTRQGVIDFVSRYGPIDDPLLDEKEFAFCIDIGSVITAIECVRDWVSLWDAHRDLISGDHLATLFGQVNEQLARFARPRIGISSDGTSVIEHIELETLWDAIVWQFAQAMVKDTRYRLCAACGHPLVAHHRMVGGDRTACSRSCRNLLYRQRQEQARQMHRDGIPIKEIARKLQTDRHTVSQWIRTTPRAKRTDRC